VNTALAPAALRSIATLARAGIYPKEKEWSKLADMYAKVWEDKTLHFFEACHRILSQYPALSEEH
jgi:hypothetical protein